MEGDKDGESTARVQARSSGCLPRVFEDVEWAHKLELVSLVA